ncbi:Histonelysine Nmethyltransferase SETMARlike [Hydra vulgaris] [Camponotus japonicus]
MDSKEFRVLIKHCFLMGKNTVQAKEWLDKRYSTSSPSYPTVKKWYAEFKCGRTCTDDAERSGRPNEAVTEENIKKVHRIVLNDRRVKVRELTS